MSAFHEGTVLINVDFEGDFGDILKNTNIKSVSSMEKFYDIIVNYEFKHLTPISGQNYELMAKSERIRPLIYDYTFKFGIDFEESQEFDTIMKLLKNPEVDLNAAIIESYNFEYIRALGRLSTNQEIEIFGDISTNEVIDYFVEPIRMGMGTINYASIRKALIMCLKGPHKHLLINEISADFDTEKEELVDEEYDDENDEEIYKDWLHQNYKRRFSQFLIQEFKEEFDEIRKSESEQESA